MKRLLVALIAATTLIPMPALAHHEQPMTVEDYVQTVKQDLAFNNASWQPSDTSIKADSLSVCQALDEGVDSDRLVGAVMYIDPAKTEQVNRNARVIWATILDRSTQYLCSAHRTKVLTSLENVGYRIYMPAEDR
jgi:hypothetical protein